MLENVVFSFVSRPACAENLDSDVLVVQVTNERMRDDVPGPLNRARHGRVLVQGMMFPGFVIIKCIGTQGAAQVPLAEHHEVINALAGTNDRAGRRTADQYS